MGGIMATNLFEWCESDSGKEWHKQVLQKLRSRSQERLDYFNNLKRNQNTHDKVDIVVYDY